MGKTSQLPAEGLLQQRLLQRSQRSGLFPVKAGGALGFGVERVSLAGEIDPYSAAAYAGASVPKFFPPGASGFSATSTKGSDGAPCGEYFARSTSMR